jgi:RNA 2',3'-cyclic 3'-phosphodiesterase
VNGATVAGRERLRLFCALRLPEPIVDEVERWAHAELAERIVPRANLHVTVAFLGHRPAAELAGVVDATRAAAAAADEPIRLEPVRYRETRSVGMLVLSDEKGRAGRFAEDLFGRLEALGVYRRERRGWLPHVTVTRFRQPPRLRPTLPPIGPFAPSDAAVYLSQLRSFGAQYDVIESFALGG